MTKVIILDDNPISLLGYIREYPEMAKRMGLIEDEEALK